MADSNYQPPTQSAIGQFFDSLFLLILVLVALFAPLYLGLAGGGKTELAVPDKSTWIGLGQNAVQQAQWEKLGFTPDSAASIITSRFDYTFSIVELIITAVVVVGYFVLLFKFSKTEYAEVIAERFKKK